MIGSEADCNVDCAHAAITTCADGDGCCPAGCTADEDGDCLDGGDEASGGCGCGDTHRGSRANLVALLALLVVFARRLSA
jgi:hypothetical protein